MGKGQDKLYITSKEWSEVWGGHKGETRNSVKRLPFHCCALSLTEFSHPLMTPDGFLFDLSNIVPFLRKYHVHPVTGAPLSGKDLVKANFHKNTEGRYACPVTGKVFNEHSKIAAIRKTGNIFSWEAIQKLCLDAKHFYDLLNDEPITKDDILIIQDPTNDEWLKKHTVSNFYYQKMNSSATKPDSSDVTVGKVVMSDSSKKVLDELKEQKDSMIAAAAAAGMKRSRQEMTGGEHVSEFGVKTTGKFGASFTSTGMEVRTRNEAAPITEADRQNARYAAVKKLGKKAHVRVVTSMGPINIELHCDLVPRTCDNFLQLAKSGYYNNTIFHRLIKNFMVQGGDPTGTGTGGNSAWGAPFADEFHPKLTHSERGILSMANSGPDSNKSQFFITFKPATHLDRKHSVFGKVVGGLETLRNIETAPTSTDDKPIEDITLLKIEIFENPFDVVDAVAAEEPAPPAAKQTQASSKAKGATAFGSGLLAALKSSSSAPASDRSAEPSAPIGKYIGK